MINISFTMLIYLLYYLMIFYAIRFFWTFRTIIALLILGEKNGIIFNDIFLL